jgi:hypothetical protein
MIVRMRFIELIKENYLIIYLTYDNLRIKTNDFCLNLINFHIKFKACNLNLNYYLGPFYLTKKLSNFFVL